MPQRLPYLPVRVRPERVEVPPHGAGEQERVLRDDGDGPPQAVQPHPQHGATVDGDVPGAGLGQAEEGRHHRGLAGAGAADDANLFLCFKTN